MTRIGVETSDGHWSAGLADWTDDPDMPLAVDPRWLTPEYLGGVIADALMDYLSDETIDRWRKYREDQPRDEHGRWVDDSAGDGGGDGNGGEVSVAAPVDANDYGTQDDPSFHEIVHGDKQGQGRLTSPREVAAFNNEVNELPDLTPEEAHTYQRIFAAEGGMKPNKNGAVAGIFPETLNTIQEAMRNGTITADPRVLALKSPRDLTIDQVLELYRTYFAMTLKDLPGGVAALSASGDGKTVAAILYPIFREGTTGIRYIQKAANKVIASLPADKRTALGLGIIEADKHFGQGTLNTLDKLGDIGKGRALRHAIAQIRREGPKGKELRRINLFDN